MKLQELTFQKKTRQYSIPCVLLPMAPALTRSLFTRLPGAENEDIIRQGFHSLDARHPAMAEALQSFGITRNGFLPDSNPLNRLPDPYYEPWELIAEQLPGLVRDGIRETVAQLPLLSTERLASDEEWRRAYVILAYATHAYVWAGEQPEEVHLTRHTIETLSNGAWFHSKAVLQLD